MDFEYTSPEGQKTVTTIVAAAAAGASAMDCCTALLACASVSPSLFSVGSSGTVLTKSDKLLRMCANDTEEHQEYRKVTLMSADEVKMLVEEEIGQDFTFVLDGRFKYSYGERCAERCVVCLCTRSPCCDCFAER